MPYLPDAEAFRRVVDGSSRGLTASLMRAGLTAIAGPYALAVVVRNLAYDHRLLAPHSASVPVISVGNLTLGGTGKTPLVAWVTRQCLEADKHPAIVSRGYGAARGQTSDEAAELAIVLPAVPHVANRDRAAGAVTATSRGADVVVLDDGFQHRRLDRTLDIVAVDATDPFGCGRIFPRGLLREPLRGLSRAQAVVLTRADTVDDGCRRAIRDTLAAAAGHTGPRVWAEATHAPHRLRTAAGLTHPLDAVRGRRVAAFCGIGNPAAFRRTLDDLGAEVCMFRVYPDHHAYRPDDIAALDAAAVAARADFVVTTLKDLVKVPHESLADVPLVAIEIALAFLSGEAELSRLVRHAACSTSTTGDARGAA